MIIDDYDELDERKRAIESVGQAFGTNASTSSGGDFIHD
jgi:hypothetical protein